jgi:hypothetical protein
VADRPLLQLDEVADAAVAVNQIRDASEAREKIVLGYGFREVRPNACPEGVVVYFL